LQLRLPRTRKPRKACSIAAVSKERHLLTKQIEAYEQEHHNLPDATPAEVLQYLMEEHDLKQTDLAEELGGQSVVSAILNGKRELNTRQVQALAARFNVSPAVFL
jgi:HTH-type transcriptional regulator/antitoxin HigA